MSYKEELKMILKSDIITDLKIESVNDLYKLKPFMEDSTLKINVSQIARVQQISISMGFKNPRQGFATTASRPIMTRSKNY